MTEKKTPSKMGRPTSAPRTVSFHIRLSEADKELLDRCAELEGCTKTELIMRGVKLIYARRTDTTQ